MKLHSCNEAGFPVRARRFLIRCGEQKFNQNQARAFRCCLFDARTFRCTDVLCTDVSAYRRFGVPTFRYTKLSAYERFDVRTFRCAETFRCMTNISFNTRSNLYFPHKTQELFSRSCVSLSFLPSSSRLILGKSHHYNVYSCFINYFAVSPYSRITDRRAEIEHHLLETQRKSSARRNKFRHWATDIRTIKLWLVTNAVKGRWMVSDGRGVRGSGALTVWRVPCSYDLSLYELCWPHVSHHQRAWTRIIARTVESQSPLFC